MTRSTLRIDDRRFNQLALGGMVAGFLLIVAALIAIITSFSASEQSVELVRHTYQVMDEVSKLEVQLERAETGRRGFLLSQNPYRLEVYSDNVRLAPETLERIAKLISDNPEQTPRIAELRRLVDQHLQELDQSMGLALAGTVAAGRARFEQNAQTTNIRQIRKVTAAVRDAEYRLLDIRRGALNRTLDTVRLILVISGILILLVGAGTFWLMRRYAGDLGRTRDRLHLLNTDLEAAVAERTVDLRRANDEIQRFAYIVSHDLRSPLVNILGFTSELEETNKSLGALIERAEKDAPHIITEDSRNAREELPEAIGFIRSSTQKMDRLINAILRLSREGRRTLTPEQLPMAKVAGEIVASMEHRLAKTGTTVTIEKPMPDLVSDRVAVEQIFSNLIENAVKYLQPGRAGEVVVRGRVNGDRLIYEVEDNGRGIDPKDHERVFDLFRRSGMQDQPGEGIGLAHVRALAYRLGGFISVKSELGHGAIFQVDLPMTYSDQGVAS
jgi:signal transduction histidine kinase